MPNKVKILVVVGPNASGKSNLAVRLAKQFNGEVISADSRQVYRDFDIGSGKITKKEMKGIPHHLLDIASPLRNFSAAQYKKKAESAIKKINSNNKLPIIAGGTGFYIDTVVHDTSLPKVKANQKLRKKLEKLSKEELLTKLEKLDPARALEIDSDNKVRLVRAIEVATELGKVPKVKTSSPYEVLWIGLKLDEKTQRSNIHKRLEKRMKGLLSEIKKLRKSGLSWKRLESFGIEYRYVSQYLQKKIDLEEMKKRIEIDSWRYAKRQMRWFKRNSKTNWFSPSEYKNVEKLTKNFLLKV